MSDSILTERRGSVFVITINRPERRNAFDFATAGAMSRAVDEFEEDPALRVAVITGAGGTFCAGMDLKAFAKGDVPFVERRGVFGMINEPPTKPVIAAVEGHVLAGGFELMLSCDLVVSTTSATFGIPEVRRGLIAASGGLVELAKRIPLAIAMELALSGEAINASRAYELGLVNRLVEEGGVLDEAVATAERIADNAPLAVKASKQILIEARDWSRAEAWGKQGDISGPVFVSDDAQEGARAFTEKRPPKWRGV